MQQFRRGELFEIVVMRGICHLVIDLDDVPQGYEPAFQGGRGKERETEGSERRKGKETEFETKRDKVVLCVLTPCIILHLMCARRC